DEAVLVCGDRFYSVWNLNPWIVTPQTPWAENITKAIQTYRPLFVFLYSISLHLTVFLFLLMILRFGIVLINRLRTGMPIIL
ncbi:hypothetical protein, partial [uncultured Alistipes sp.]|uniref:hypothetical protein n=1 Tax=uncultured Alistipes sp. TaxID=538949 RepID=UPI00259BC858